jgi:hypothetical protein
MIDMLLLPPLVQIVSISGRRQEREPLKNDSEVASEPCRSSVLTKRTSRAVLDTSAAGKVLDSYKITTKGRLVAHSVSRRKRC